MMDATGTGDVAPVNTSSVSTAVREPTPGRHLLVASTGGHLAQLVKWSHIIGSASDSLFVTFESPQSTSLLQGRRVLYVPYVSPRDFLRTASAFQEITRSIGWRSENFTAAVSTGAAVGIAGLIAARLHRVPSFFFESVSRVNGPSLTGKILSWDRGIVKHCQYDSWAGGQWGSRQSLFDAYASVAKSGVECPRLFVTLGTIRPYRFDALIDAILATGMADENTVWQLGVTHRDDLPGCAVSQMAAADFETHARAADVVVTHAGVGTIMHLLEMGIYPIVIPRRAKRREHVDDHQTQIAGLVSKRRISEVSEVEHLTRDTVLRAATLRVQPTIGRKPEQGTPAPTVGQPVA